MSKYKDEGDIDLEVEEVRAGGGRISEARAEEIAKEYYRAKGRQGGRPPLSSEGSAQVAARVPTATKVRLGVVARETGRVESEVIREALDEYLAHH